MASNPGKGERSFKTNIESLLDELSLAFHWQRPSLLLTIHKSILSEQKARESLTRKLKMAGYPVLEIRVDESHPDVAGRILSTPNPAATVFYVSGLERGGGPDGKDAYRALNLGRELFVENQLKVVFWLTENEATHIPRFAPDFWAFRHRVIEFASSAPRLSGERLTPLLLWHGPAMSSRPGDLQETIQAQEGLLAQLPKTPDSLAARIEACYLIGRACWAAGDPDRALKSLMAGLGLAQDKDFAHLSSWLLNGIAILRHARGRYQEVMEILQDLVQHDPDDGILNMNLAIALCSLGKNHEGLTRGERTISRRSVDVELVHSLAHLKLALGKMDEALQLFQRGVELRPKRASSHEALAGCYFRMGRVDEALAEAQLAQQYADDHYDRQTIFEQALQGEPDTALRLLASAVAAGKVTKSAIRNDPNLSLVIDPVFIAEAI